MFELFIYYASKGTLKMPNKYKHVFYDLIMNKLLHHNYSNVS